MAPVMKLMPYSKLCGLSFDQLSVEQWPFPNEPVDMPVEWEWGKSEDGSSQAREPAGQVEMESPRVIDSSHAEHPNRDSANSKPIKRSGSFLDREDCLQRLTVVYAPTMNIVYRARTCGCRLAGDASPFAPNLDLAWDTPCRLHFPAEATSKYGAVLHHPIASYDPASDPYFDRFGGHLAFATFISFHAVVRRSIDVRKLLPKDRLEEGAAALQRALADPDHHAALLQWRDEFNQWYIKWKSEYGEESERRKREVREKKKPRHSKRRGSF